MHFSHAALKKSNIQPIGHLITEPFPKLFQSDAPLIVSILLFYFHVFWTSLCSKILHYASCQYVRGYIYIWSVNMSQAGASRLAAFFVSSHHKWYIFKTLSIKFFFSRLCFIPLHSIQLFLNEKHIQLAIDSPNLYIICILHITTHY